MIAHVSPTTALRRHQARMALAMTTGNFKGARRDRRETLEWRATSGSADSDTLDDLDTLRARSRDLVRNQPLATGAINTVVTSTVGDGLRPHARVDRRVLSRLMSDDEIDDFERQAERLWSHWARGTGCDATRTQTFVGLQDLMLRSTLESGDCFARRRSIGRLNSPFSTAVQLIEADRVSNPRGQPDRPGFAGGVETNSNGTPVRFHIRSGHPGDFYAAGHDWTAVRPVDRFGEPLILHLYQKRRPGLTRGVPYLAPVIEPLRMLEKYSEAELMAAVISSAFTVFVKTLAPEGGLQPAQTPGAAGDRTGNHQDFKMGAGAILDLGLNEEIQIADPKRPNDAFDPFTLAVLRQIGVALEIPFELLVKHFTASFSAAQAAILEAWKFFKALRAWLVSGFCQPVYEWVITEAVLLGLLDAPGFVGDPLLRAAYLGTEWTGPPRGAIRQDQEVAAAVARIDNDLSTRQRETAELTGADWDRVIQQRKREEDRRVDAGTRTPVTVDTDTAEDLP